ncbi:DUF4159 domain-containing protein [Candidatus Poribacteria bacterium]|nr:DUF4159 domain-containing protein [Candidatus Poribacteria bacterium]
MRKERSRSLDSFLISAAIHVALVIFFASYIVVSEPPQESIGVTWVEVPSPEIKIEKPLIKEPLVKRKATDRDTGPKSKQTRDLQSSDIAQVVKPAPNIVRKSVELNPDAVTSKILPSVTTSAEIPNSDDMAFAGPVTTAKGAQVGRGAVTGVTRAGGKGKSRGLSIINPSMAADAGVALENLKSPTSLPKDEIGGVLIGQGSDISGHIRLIRVKHGLSDWWQDPTALTGLVDWLNKNTRIKADMKVAGGVLSLDDPKILDAPVIIMTGHDRSETKSRNLMRPERNGGELDKALTQEEKAGLREYLVDRGGMLFFDDCGFHGLFADEVKSILREVLPEYNIERIPRTHELFNCYYNLPGPPRGSEMFWGSENEGKGAIFPYLQGITIGRRLAVVFSRKDYLCAIETVEIPSHTQLRYRYSPDVYKFMTNLLVYAMKRGGITDRSDYN